MSVFDGLTLGRARAKCPGMLHLAYANQLELLVEPLCARIHAALTVDPLTPVRIVVPNRSVAQYVRFQVAQRNGIAAHLDFVFLRRFLTDLVKAADPTLEVLDVNTLQLLLYARLSDPSFIARKGLDGVRRYVSTGDAAEADLRRLQLAGQLARLFEEYAFSRRPMLRGWHRRPALAHTSWADAEEWQRRVYRALFDGAGAITLPGEAPILGQLDLLGGARIRGMMLPDAVASIHPRALKLPPVLHVFGLSYVAPAFAEIFARLGRATTLCVYGINPCLEFWEDVDTGIAAVRDGWIRQGHKVDDIDHADPFELDRAGDTPALRLWGRPGREYIRLLNQLTDCEFRAAFTDPGTDALLARLQRDILVRAPERPWIETPTGLPDESLRILACPGIRREVEIVADEIWRLIQASPPDNPLRFHEIAVMVTDAHRASYLIQVDSVFRERHGIPFNVIDGPLSGQSRVLDAIERLLMLPTSEFTHTDLMSLITHPSIAGHDIDLEAWQRWISAVNIRFGADQADLADTYLERDVHNWDQGLRRLALGVFMTGEPSGDTEPFPRGEDPLLPYETPPGDWQDVATLVERARSLIQDAHAIVVAHLSVSDWAMLLARYISHYIDAEQVADEVALSRCLSTLEALAAADYENLEIPFPIARSLLLQRLKPLEGRRGQHQADGVVVSSLLPMRAIPFKAIFVLGLGEGDFPAPPKNDPLDLRQGRRRAGDVTSAERDRYLFLDTLLAARDTLRLSYVARDAQTGETRAPSSVLQELSFILRGYVGPDTLNALTITWPVSAFDPIQFPDLSQKPTAVHSVSPEAWRGARARALREHLASHLKQRPPSRTKIRRGVGLTTRHALDALFERMEPPKFDPDDLPDSIELPIAAIQRFLESPIQGSARYVLGLYDDDRDALASEEDEPLDFDRFVAFKLLRSAFWSGDCSAADVSAAYDAEFEHLTLLGKAPQGLFGEMSRARDARTLDRWRQQIEAAGIPDRSDWRRLRLGRAPEHDDTEILPALTIPVPVRDRIIPIHLHGALTPVSADLSSTLRCLSSRAVDQKHTLPGFLSLMLLTAAGQPVPSSTRVILAPNTEQISRRSLRQFATPPPEVAQRWLRDVLADLLSGVHNYRLPIELVLRWIPKLKQDTNAPMPRLFYGDFDSDKYGPIPEVWKRFQAPEQDWAAKAVQRRFWLFIQAQDRA